MNYRQLKSNPDPEHAQALARVGMRKRTRQIVESDRRKPPWKVWKVSLDTIRRSNIAEVVGLILTTLPFLIPQLGIPAMILLRILQGRAQYGERDRAMTFVTEGDDTDTMHIGDAGDANALRCMCQAHRVNTLLLPCTHQVWCSACAAVAVQSAEQQHDVSAATCRAQCPECGVAVHKVILLK